MGEPLARAAHIARKRIPDVSLPDGATAKLAKPNGIKLETFVFDTVAHTEGGFAMLQARTNSPR